jgi:hypothetical protein
VGSLNYSSYLLWCYTAVDPQVLARLVLLALVLYCSEGGPQVLAWLCYLLWCYTEGDPHVLAWAGATCSGAILKATLRYWQGWCYLLWCYTE